MKIHLPQFIRLLTVTTLIVWTATGSAQLVVAPPPEAPVTAGAMQEYQPWVPDVVGKALGFNETGTPFHWGPLQLSPRIDYSFIYGTGIQATPGRQVDSIVEQVAPGVSLAIGDHITLDYAPLWTLYSSPLLTNTFDQSASLVWGTTYEDWVLGLSQGYSTSSGPRVDTGAQTHQEAITTGATATDNISADWQLQFSLNQALNYVDQSYAVQYTHSKTNLVKLGNSEEWSTMEWLNYKFWQDLTGGIGVGLGYSVAEGSPDQTYEQYEARLAYQVTGKLSVTVHGGLQDLQTPKDLINPVFGASIKYEPFKTTSFTLTADRAVSPSAFQGQLTETTGFSADFTQRFLTWYYLDLSGGYGTTSYLLNETGVADRTDDSYSFGVRLSTSFLKNGTFAATYSWSKNGSNQKVFVYTSNQIGFTIGYRY